MELDSRIIEGKKQLDCFDTEIAKQFIGKKGYFSHYIDNYADLKNTVLGTLGSTGDTFHESFCCTEEPFDNYYYEFFLPAEWVKEPEKKYRPYKDVEEFFDDVGCTLGDVIRFRKKDTTEEEYHTLLTGFKGNARVNIDLGDGGYYSLSDLFSLFELYTSDGWRPFGIKE